MSTASGSVRPGRDDPSIAKDIIYFSYGSNMSREKMDTRGKLNTAPIGYTDVWVGRVHGWRLTFDIVAMPPMEPVMGSIEQADDSVMYGVVYRIATPTDWDMLLVSEMGTRDESSYNLREVDIECYSPEDADNVTVRRGYTLVTNPRFRSLGCLERNLFPSVRYMNLLLSGAKSERLPAAYIQLLEDIPTARKWSVGVLMIAIGLTAPLFIMFGRRTPFWAIPHKVWAVGMYGRHEGLAKKVDPSVWDRSLMLALRITMFFVYASYMPASLFFLLVSPSARSMMMRLVQISKQTQPQERGETVEASQSETSDGVDSKAA